MKNNSKPKVLLIEDDLPLLRMYQIVLQKAGCELITALDGEEGLQKIRNEMPNLILLDLVLPKKNGFQVLEELKNDAKLSLIPVVCLSVLNQEEDIKRCKQLGAAEFLIKTEIMPNDLVTKVLSYLTH